MLPEQTPQQQPGHDLLPVVTRSNWPPGPEDDVLRLAEDVAYLRQLGYLPFDADRPTAEQLVRANALTGIYRDHVRAVGQTYQCPPWCTAIDHPRAGIALEPVRHAAEWVTCAVSAYGSGANLATPTVVLTSSFEELSAPQARTLARELRAAARLLDEVAR